MGLRLAPSARLERRGRAGRGSPRAADEFRQLMSHWPTGVSVVTSCYGDEPVGCTVNALMSVSLAPPLLLVSLKEGSRTLSGIRRSRRFAVNLLGAHQGELCDRFARIAHADRFQDLRHHYRDGLPVLDDTTAVVACEVQQMVPCGDHSLVVGRVLWCDLPAEPCAPLLFHRSATHPLVLAAESGPCE